MRRSVFHQDTSTEMPAFEQANVKDRVCVTGDRKAALIVDER